MRQHFYKAGFLISIFTMVFVLFSLCGIAAVNSIIPKKAFDCLSDSYVITYNDSENVPKTVEEYYKNITKNQISYIAGVKWDSIRSEAVYYNDDKLFDINLVSGRLFTKEDFDMQRNCLLVRKDVKNQCIKKNGTLFYRYKDTEYEVIGVYEDKMYRSVTSVKYIFNMKAKALADNNKWNFGFFDAGQRSEECINKSLEYTVFGSNAMKSENVIGSNVKFMILLYIAVALLVFLNVFSATVNWMRGKNKELAVRSLVGASPTRLYTWIFVNYLMHVSLSCILGMLLVKLFLVIINIIDVSPSLVMMFGNHFYLSGIVVAFLAVILIGSIVILYYILKRRRKEHIVLIRGDI